MNFLIIKDSESTRGWVDGESLTKTLGDLLSDYHVPLYDYALVIYSPGKYPYSPCVYIGDNTDVRIIGAPRIVVAEGLGKDMQPIFEAYARML